MTEDRSVPLGDGGGDDRRGWVRAVTLFAVVLAISVFEPTVLVAIPFLALTAVFGMRGVGTAVLAALAMIIAVSGASGEAIWWVERAWALVVAGLFTALTLRRPEASFSARAMGAVAGTAAVMVVFLALRPEAWGVVDYLVRDRMADGVAMALEALRLLRGEALPAVLVTAFYETVELQADLFPATAGLASMGGLGVAWWAYRRFALDDGAGLAPLGRFRFNDHLVWVFIAGLVLTLTRWSDVLARLGENVLAFMGALYAVRGAAVVLFLGGGLSFFGWVTLILGLILVPPLVLTGAMIIGIGDTWLDIRARFLDATA